MNQNTSHRSRVSDEDAVTREELPDERKAFLAGLGERVRMLRARCGVTRKALAVEADVSERYLANLETGVGNASILFLRQLTSALDCTLAEIVGDETTATPDWLRIRELLIGRNRSTIEQARLSLEKTLSLAPRDPNRNNRIALIGLRGAGKSTLGRMLADERKLPFIELTRVIEQLAGCPPSEIHSLYGPSAYRRYEQRALDAVIQEHPRAVIASPGGLVSEPASLKTLLMHCFTVWLQASPEEHMRRVVAQGDLRPIAGNKEAMDDLKSILAARSEFYSRADMTFNTGKKALAQCYSALHDRLAARLAAQ